MNLLSLANSNAKLKKNNKHSQYLSFALFLAPARQAVADHDMRTVCPASSPGCRAACLFTAGRGRIFAIREARIRKTKLFLNYPELFMEQLYEDIDRAIRQSERQDKQCAIRLNGTSDIDWENYPVINSYPKVQFYDYTKDVRRLGRTQDNYHLTLSASEVNTRVCKLALARGHNVSVVFNLSGANKGNRSGQSRNLPLLPANYWGFPVIDGEDHDLRFLDPSGSRGRAKPGTKPRPGFIVGLRAKGEATKDLSGFVKQVGE